jgi:hypothetical protein
MKGHRWNFSGFTRSYWDFYFGYGLLAIIWGIVEVIILWQLATSPGRVRSQSGRSLPHCSVRMSPMPL